MFCCCCWCCWAFESTLGSNCFRWAAIILPVGRLGTAGLGPLAAGSWVALLLVVVVELRISCEEEEIAEELEELSRVVLELLFSLLALSVPIESMPKFLWLFDESTCMPVTLKPIGGGRLGMFGGGWVGFSNALVVLNEMWLVVLIDGETDGECWSVCS